MLILDIFALRARSKEGKLQVELAQLKYLMPRLTGKGVACLLYTSLFLQRLNLNGHIMLKSMTAIRHLHIHSQGVGIANGSPCLLYTSALPTLMWAVVPRR